jgi:hypothetical protein
MARAKQNVARKTVSREQSQDRDTRVGSRTRQLATKSAPAVKSGLAVVGARKTAAGPSTSGGRGSGKKMPPVQGAKAGGPKKRPYKKGEFQYSGAVGWGKLGQWGF